MRPALLFYDGRKYTPAYAGVFMELRLSKA